MHWLALACLLEFGFAQLFKLAQQRGYSSPVILSANYLTLAWTLAAFLLINGAPTFTVTTIKVGVITGTAFICSMSILTKALQLISVAPVLTSLRMSIVVPVVVSAQVWGETVRAGQVIGISLALLGLLLMSCGEKPMSRSGASRALWIVPMVFCAQGISHSCLRWVHYSGLDNRLFEVLLVVGLTAGTLGTVVVLLQGHRPERIELLAGAGIGLYNLVALVVILSALARVPATVFFPTLGCTVVVLDQLSAHLIWKEPLSRIARFGALLALAAMFLVLR